MKKRAYRHPRQTRAEMLEYLYQTYQIIQRYHNHKESVAWGTVVLYVGALGAIAFNVRVCNLWQSLTFSATLIAALAVASAHVRRQFNMREIAERIVTGCQHLVLDILSGSTIPEKWLETQMSTQMPEKETECIATQLWHWAYPGRIRISTWAPRVLQEKMDEVEPPGASRSINQFETLAYIIMIIATLSIVVGKWKW